jgi:dienelactone hydrolase
VSVYYPAVHGPVKRPSYIDRSLWRSVARAALRKAPAFIFSHLPKVQIDLAEGAPLHPAAEELPVLIFSHGNSGLPAMYWSMVSNFVQAGHIVVCPQHNDGSAATVRLEDGSSYDYEDPETKFADVTDAEKRKALQDTWRRQQLERRVAEATASMDWILSCATDSSSRWYQVADTEQLAYVGHSFGGATAVVAAERDSRAKVCVAYDCWAGTAAPIDPKMLRSGIRRCPTLLVQCEAWTGGEVDKTLQAHLLTPWEKQGHPANLMWTAPKAGHHNFTDFPAFAPNLLRLLRLAGSVNGVKCLQATFSQTMECARPNPHIYTHCHATPSAGSCCIAPAAR